MHTALYQKSPEHGEHRRKCERVRSAEHHLLEVARAILASSELRVRATHCDQEVDEEEGARQDHRAPYVSTNTKSVLTLANFERPDLGCIETDLRNERLIQDY